MTKKIIAHLVNYSRSNHTSGGGIRSFLEEMLINDKMKAYDHVFLSMAPENPDPISLSLDGYRDLVCPLPDLSFIPSYHLSRRLKPLVWSWQLKETIKNKGIDLLHSHVPDYLDGQVHAAKLINLPFIWTVHGYSGNHKYVLSQKSNIGRGLRQMRPDQQITSVVSVATGRTLAQDHPIIADKFVVTYGGASTKRLNRTITRSSDWYVPYFLPQPDTVVFGTLARLSKEKRLDLMVRAFSQFLNENVSEDKRSLFHLLIAGTGDEGENLEQIIKESHLCENIHLIGFQEDVSRFLRQIDIFLLSSDAEGFPIALIEAMYMGVPVISTNAGGISEILTNSESSGGILVNMGDVAGFQKALTQSIDPTWRYVMSAHAQTKAENFTVKQTSEAFDNLYQKLLKG